MPDMQGTMLTSEPRGIFAPRLPARTGSLPDGRWHLRRKPFRGRVWLHPGCPQKGAIGKVGARVPERRSNAPAKDGSDAFDQSHAGSQTSLMYRSPRYSASGGSTGPDPLSEARKCFVLSIRVLRADKTPLAMLGFRSLPDHVWVMRGNVDPQPGVHRGICFP